ncbi:MAG: PKD domain-containing protein, partial [Chitinophagales bacterium]
MKLVFIFLPLIFVSLLSAAQLTEIWNYRYGGTKDDFTGGIIATTDGGAISWGYSYSDATGDKTEDLKGKQDYWVVKADENGLMQWNKSFGGAAFYNYMTCVMETHDQGFILGGYTPADSSFDKSEDNRGGNDYWIIRIDSLGNKLWDKTYGTKKDDFMSCVYATSDGGFLLGGTTSADSSGDKGSLGKGGADYWIIKTDSNGVYQWDKDYGGTKEDYISRVLQTKDGGYYLAGLSYSGITGDKTENTKGGSDFWVIKIDGNGNYLWDKDYGTSSAEGGLSSYSFMDITLDDGIILAAITDAGINGDKTVPNWGNVYADYWAVRLDSNGNKLWDQHYGGNAEEDEFYNVWHTADGGFLLSGASYSGISGDKSENNGSQAEQAWCIKVDSIGNKIWDHTLLTLDHNEGGMCSELQDGCVLINTYTNANAGGEKTQDSWANSYDYFFAKFCYGLQIPDAAFTVSDSAICPQLCINFSDLSTNSPTDWNWSFPGGSPSGSTDQNPVNICYNTSGVYDVTLITANPIGSDTIILSSYITVYAPLAISISQNGSVLTCNPSANSYQWFMDGIIIPGATTQTVTISQTGTYTVEILDSNGCSSASDLVVTSIPSPDFIAADSTVCEKFCINFFDQSTNNPIGWNWNFEGGDPASSAIQNPLICYAIPGVYDVTLITTSANGLDTLTLPGYITVYPTPLFPSISQFGYTLTSSVANSYQWQFNAVDIPGATNQSYTILQTGFYTVIIGDSNGCQNSVTEYILIDG